MILQENYTLSNGVEIPKIALGTWFISDDTVAQSVIEAIKLGYRHIDTAAAYGNERGVGEGIHNSGVDRKEIFLTTKLAAEVKSYEEAKAAIDAALERLGLEYIDLMIIHSPKPWNQYHKEDPFAEGNLAAWKALEEAYEAGKLKAIGVSNFQEADIENISRNAEVKPMVNQILVHIGKTPLDLINYCKEQNIAVQAYSPFAHGHLMNDEKVVKMAEKYQVSVPQLAMRYCLELGLIPLPKTTNPVNMKNNADVDFEISKEDMETLLNIEPFEDYGEDNIFPVYGGVME